MHRQGRHVLPDDGGPRDRVGERSSCRWPAARRGRLGGVRGRDRRVLRRGRALRGRHPPRARRRADGRPARGIVRERPSLAAGRSTGPTRRGRAWSSRTTSATRRSTSGPAPKAASCPGRDHRLRAGRARRRRLRGSARGGRHGDGRAGVRRGGVDEVGLRCLQPGDGHDRRAEPARSTTVPSSSTSSRTATGWLVRDRARDDGRGRRGSWTPRPTAPSSMEGTRTSSDHGSSLDRVTGRGLATWLDG